MTYEVVLPKAKQVESLLRELGHTGAGIHQLVTSAGPALDRDVARAARKVATIRNKLVHEANFALSGDDLRGFSESAEFVISALQRQRAARYSRGTAPGMDPVRIAVLAGLIIAGLLFLFGR
ncbi:MAG: hypothetical protein EPN77_19345 [Candidimonas sp.]|nr:MAG: hypothetical protein EPN77_19345 [Candidimonas sp.]